MTTSGVKSLFITYAGVQIYNITDRFNLRIINSLMQSWGGTLDLP